ARKRRRVDSQGSVLVELFSVVRGLSNRRRWRSSHIAGTDLYRRSPIADNPTPAVIDRLRCPVTTRAVNRLWIGRIHNVAGRPGGDNGTGNHRAADNAGSNPRSPSPASTVPTVAAMTVAAMPAAPTPVGGGVGGRGGQAPGD